MEYSQETPSRAWVGCSDDRRSTPSGVGRRVGCFARHFSGLLKISIAGLRASLVSSVGRGPVPEVEAVRVHAHVRQQRSIGSALDACRT